MIVTPFSFLVLLLCWARSSLLLVGLEQRYTCSGKGNKAVATACCDAGCRHAVWSLCHHRAWIYPPAPHRFQLTRHCHGAASVRSTDRRYWSVWRELNPHHVLLYEICTCLYLSFINYLIGQPLSFWWYICSVSISKILKLFQPCGWKSIPVFRLRRYFSFTYILVLLVKLNENTNVLPSFEYILYIRIYYFKKVKKCWYTEEMRWPKFCSRKF